MSVMPDVGNGSFVLASILTALVFPANITFLCLCFEPTHSLHFVFLLFIYILYFCNVSAFNRQLLWNDIIKCYKQELTYDYGYELDSVIGPEGKIKELPCYCGTADCRKRLY